jgi:hypothetical protein
MYVSFLPKFSFAKEMRIILGLPVILVKLSPFVALNRPVLNASFTILRSNFCRKKTLAIA